jgi:hypothetical protein
MSRLLICYGRFSAARTKIETTVQYDEVPCDGASQPISHWDYILSHRDWGKIVLLLRDSQRLDSLVLLPKSLRTAQPLYMYSSSTARSSKYDHVRERHRESGVPSLLYHGVGRNLFLNVTNSARDWYCPRSIFKFHEMVSCGGAGAVEFRGTAWKMGTLSLYPMPEGGGE